MKVIIDRFEGDFAVVELPDRSMAEIPKRLLPGAKEGDVIMIGIDEAERKIRSEKIEKLMGEVFEKE